jgi:hypothetical protein
MFFKPPTSPSFAQLVESPNLLRELQHFPPVPATISYAPSATPREGAFKIAYLGHSSIPLFGTSSQEVCIKQTFIKDASKRSGKIIVQGQTQAKYLSIELNCLGWAHALMELVYAFIRCKEETLGKPDFTVPQMRFVQAGLAIPKEDNALHVFLLEEVIETNTPSWFTKYLNNSSARPLKFPDNTEMFLRAQFLSFAQHVQFIETGGLAFVSDFQGNVLTLLLIQFFLSYNSAGGPSLLTDPQIITNPYVFVPFLCVRLSSINMLALRKIVGLIFGEGNTNFETFVEEHTCNHFCKFYHLPDLLQTETRSQRSQGSNRALYGGDEPDFPIQIMDGDQTIGMDLSTTVATNIK